MLMKRWMSVLALLAIGCMTWATVVHAQEPVAVTPAPGLELEAGAAPEAAEGHGGGFMSIVFGAGFFGGLIWLLLLACSMASVTFTIDSFMNIREKKILPPALIANVKASMEQGDVLKAIKFCEETPSPLAEILLAGFQNVQEGFEVVQDAVIVKVELESEKVLSRISYLNVVSNTAPMLGLIGTVQGMILAFFTLGTQQAGAAQQAMLAVNISHGLWATAVGLTIAVISTVFFYFFKNKATRMFLEIEASTLDLIKTLRNVEVVSE